MGRASWIARFALGLLVLGAASVEADRIPGPGQEDPVPASDEARDQVLPGRLGQRTRIRSVDSHAQVSGLAGAASIDPGSWLALPPPVPGNPVVNVYDSTADRLIVCGGLRRPLETWVLKLGVPDTWHRLEVEDAPLIASVAATAVDVTHLRLFFVEGFRREAPGIGNVYVLQLGGSPKWTRVPVPANAVRPGGRDYAAAAYDSRRNRLVIHGGIGRGLFDDVWALDLVRGEWTRIEAAGDSIPPRLYEAAIYDRDRDRMLVYGGAVETSPHILNASDELWSLDLGEAPAWHRMPSIGDSIGKQQGGSILRDPADGSFLLAYGQEVFRLSPDPMPVSTHLAPSGAPSRDRGAPAIAFDSRRGRLLRFGGYPHPIDALDVDALTLRPAPSWSAMSADSLPTARFGHAMAFDSKRERLVIFGGVAGAGRYLSDPWSAPLESPDRWSPLAASGPMPPPRHEPVSIYDPVRDRMVVFGGWTYPQNYFNDTWTLSFDPAPTWAEAHPAGPPPGGRRAHAAVYDPLRDRMLVFSGFGASGELGDVWALDLAGEMRWSPVITTGPAPRSRGFPSAIYDPTRDRVVLHGGVADQSSLGDAWSLSLSGLRWSYLCDSPALTRHTAVYDLDRDRMMVFGGWWVDYDFFVSEEGIGYALEFSPTSHWTYDLYPDAPPTRVGHTAFYDSERSRMVVFGGGGFAEYRNDTWLLQFAQPALRSAWLIASSADSAGVTLVWQSGVIGPATAVVERSGYREAWHEVGVVSQDARARFEIRDDHVAPGWPYRYRLRAASPGSAVITAETEIATRGAPGLQMLGAWPNPVTNGRLSLRIALASTHVAQVDVFDLSGRRLATEQVTPANPGVVLFEPRGRWRAGMYFARLTQDGRSVIGKVCVLR